MTNLESLISILDQDAEKILRNVSLKFLEGRKVVITGASGIVGINLISAISKHNEQYSKKRIQVYALTKSQPKGVFKELLTRKYVNVLSMDLSELSDFSSIPKSDFIIHAAGYGQPGKFLEDKIKTISINSTVTINLSKRLKKGGSFLFISSSEIYSGNTKKSYTEEEIGNTQPNHPRSCYIEGKRIGESITSILREKKIHAVSARLALAYGPGVKKDDQRVLNELISKGLNGKISLLDAGEALRTYCYITDVIEMLLLILKKSKWPVYNVGGKSTLSIKELALKIGRIMDVKVTIPKSKAYHGDAPKIVNLNLKRVEGEYNRSKYVDLDSGLNKTIAWIKLIHEK